MKDDLRIRAVKKLRLITVFGACTLVFGMILSCNDGDTGTGTEENEPPVITLNPPETDSVRIGGEYDDPFATADDPEEGDLTSKIQTKGTIDISTPGSYTRSYIVTDSKGLSDTVTRTIVVIEAYSEITKEMVADTGDSVILDDTKKIYVISALGFFSMSHVVFKKNTALNIEKEVRINDGSWTFEENIEVKVAKRAAIHVSEGIINILGTESKPVTFTALTPGEIWGKDGNAARASYGIIIRGGGDSISILEHFEIDEATTGLSVGSWAKVSNAKISNCEYAGLYIDLPDDTTKILDIDSSSITFEGDMDGIVLSGTE
jgi:hypothetical protein